MIKLPAGLKNINLKGIDFRDQKTQTIVLIALLSLMVFIIYLCFIFFPQVGRVTSLLGRTVKISVDLKSARSLIAQRGELEKKFDEHNKKIELYERKLPAEQEIPSLLENLSNMAKDSNIKIIGITPALSYLKEQKSKKNQIYQEIPIAITAKSGYHELGYFLSNLENADRFMKVVDIDIKANKATPKTHDVELIVCTYILLAEK